MERNPAVIRAVVLAPVIIILASAATLAFCTGGDVSLVGPTVTATATGLADADVETDAEHTPAASATGAGHGLIGVPIPGPCTSRGMLPDPLCTPGARNPAVTQATIRETICRPGWASSVRPPASYTTPLKAKIMLGYQNPPGTPMDISRLDHLIPISVGGDPRSVDNLWPERAAESKIKDIVEGAANASVCSGKTPLAQAQDAMAKDWVEFGRQLGVLTANGTPIAKATADE